MGGPLCTLAISVPTCTQGKNAYIWQKPILMSKQLIFMTIELLIGIAIGYIPCESLKRFPSMETDHCL